MFSSTKNKDNRIICRKELIIHVLLSATLGAREFFFVAKLHPGYVAIGLCRDQIVVSVLTHEGLLLELVPDSGYLLS